MSTSVVLLKRSAWLGVLLAVSQLMAAAPPPIVIDTPMAAPALGRARAPVSSPSSVPACREFYQKYYDDRGYLQCFLRWGANDGPDDAFENFNRWPELHALGADDEILQLYLKAHEGMTPAVHRGEDDATCPPGATACT